MEQSWISAEFTNESVVRYIEAMAEAMAKDFNMTLEQAYTHLHSLIDVLHQLFDVEPEVLYHDDPGKWSEILAIRLGLIEKRQIEFL